MRQPVEDRRLGRPELARQRLEAFGRRHLAARADGLPDGPVLLRQQSGQACNERADLPGPAIGRAGVVLVTGDLPSIPAARQRVGLNVGEIDAVAAQAGGDEMDAAFHLRQPFGEGDPLFLLGERGRPGELLGPALPESRRLGGPQPGRNLFAGHPKSASGSLDLASRASIQFSATLSTSV